MSKHKDLQVKLQAARDLVSSCKVVYFEQKNRLTAMETALIDAKIASERAQEELETYEFEYVIEHSLDAEQDVEIAAFKIRMPAILELIKNEPVLSLLTLTDLGN